MAISNYKIPLLSGCPYCPYTKDFYYIIIFLVTNRLCCYCVLISRKLNFTQLLNDTAMIISLLLSRYVSEESNVCHVMQFSCLFSCVVSI